MAESDEFLRISNLHAWYGESHILHGVDLTVHKGEVVTLLGRNGAGRTTTVKSIVGLVGKRTGSITINGRESIDMAPHNIAKLGIGYCPEERGIFASLSCEENLLLPPVIAGGGMPIDEIYEMFPNLLERKNSPGTRLSGGEQQMLAVARALVLNPKLLLLDEPLEGLAPIIVEELLRAIARITREEGLSAIIVEQHPQAILAISHQAVVLDHGTVVHTSDADTLRQQPELLDRLLGVSRH
jgi:branched-chain amino acid transport system ATP-binding protein